VTRKKRSRKVSALYKNHAAVRSGIEYAEDVVAGFIPAGKYTIAACARQLKDLQKKRFAYTFDADEAERVINIIEHLPHTKDKWARTMISLEPWQLFCFSTLFGWVQKSDGLRRFREAYWCMPRKQGKSLVASTIGVYMLGLDGEQGAEIYCGATTERQANEVFKPAKRMVQLTEALREDIGIFPYASALTIDSDGSTFQRIVGTPGDGQSPSCAIIDEYHEHATTEQYDTMQSGMMSRSQPLLLVITTAGASYGGPCYLHEQDCKKVLDGVMQNDRLFAIIYHADEEDDWTSRAALVKANPNLGVSVMEDTLTALQKQAANSPQHQNRFRTKHLNQWVSARTAWVNMLKWKRCQNQRLKLDDYEGQQCIEVLDLASKSDLAVALRLFWHSDEQGKKHYTAFPRFYLPEDAVLDDRTGNYTRWLHNGILSVTEGNEIDFRRIREDVREDMARFDVQEVVFDPWRATQLAQELAEEGATTVEYRNTVQNMSEPMKELEAAINGRRFHHDGNEVMTWCASNVTVKIDAKDNIYPRKEMPHLKIDGIVAMVMGVGRLMYREDSSGSIDEWLANPITAG